MNREQKIEQHAKRLFESDEMEGRQYRMADAPRLLWEELTDNIKAVYLEAASNDIAVQEMESEVAA